MTSPESSPSNCQQCGTALSAGANFCSHCGSRVGVDRFCPGCGEPFGPNGQFCSHCGETRSAADRERGETREAFRRRVRDHVEAGWELKTDRGNQVTLVDRSVGPIPVHILLLFLTSGVGNLLYGWYHYSKLADYRYLSVGDGRQPRPPGSSAASDTTTATGDTTATVLSYLAGGIIGFVAVWMLVVAASGGASPIAAGLGLAFLLGGLAVLPPVRRRLGRRYPLTTVGREKTVDHRIVYPHEGYDEPCVVCGTRGRSGLLRRRRDETVVAGIPIRTHEQDHNFYCEGCASDDLFGGVSEATPGDRESELSTAETN